MNASKSGTPAPQKQDSIANKTRIHGWHPGRPSEPSRTRLGLRLVPHADKMAAWEATVHNDMAPLFGAIMRMRGGQ